MIKKQKTKAQLLAEVAALRRQVAELHHGLLHGPCEQGGAIASHDLTERRRREASSQESEERYRTVVNALSEGIVLHQANGEIVACNVAAEQVLGLSQNQMIGRTSIDPRCRAIHEDGSDFPGETHPAMTTLKSGQPQRDVIMGIHKPEGGFSWININTQPLFRSEEPTPYAVVASFADVTEHKRAEMALRESEERFRAQYQGFPMPTYTWRRIGEDFVLVDYNTAAHALTGGGVIHLLRKTARELYHNEPEIPEELARCWAERTTLRREMSYRLRTTGELKELAVSYVFVPPDMVMVHTEDITKRKQAEMALRESEERLRLIMQAAPVLLYDLDLKSGVIRGNDGNQRLFKIKPPSGFGSDWWQTQLHPEDRAATLASLQTALAGQEQFWTGEYRSSRGDGSYAYVVNRVRFVRNAAGDLVRMVGAVIDISQRKQTELALQESEARYRNLFENANDAIAVVNLDRSVASINRAMEKLLGWSREELIGRDYYTVLTPAGVALVEERERQLRNGEKIRSIFEHEFVRKDGSLASVEGRTRFIRDQAGTLIGFQGIYRDISERKRAEEERRQLQTQLLQAQKLEAIGVLAGGIAHDFNNILSVILGNTELVMDHVPPESRAHGNLIEVLTASRRAQTLVRQLLTFSRPDYHGRRSIWLQPLVEETLRFLLVSLPKTVALQADLSCPTAVAFANSTQIQQLLMNLCLNAIQAMQDKGGILHVGLQRVDAEEYPRRTNGQALSGPCLALTVRDTGCGMSPEVQERIFEPFFTTKPIGEGTGLGLAMAYGIVRNHDGAITLDSLPGQGTTFRVYLPLTDGAVETVTASSESGRSMIEKG